MCIYIKRLPSGAGLPLPRYQTAGSAGLDLSAAIKKTKIIGPGDRALIPTGFALALPSGIEAQIRPRSGLALKNGVTVLNAPGTIDSDYRGEISVLLINHGHEPFMIERGDRIAQMIISEVIQVRLIEVETLSETNRGTDGYGSTGSKSTVNIGVSENGAD
jgi:dUTP pyrophosphatase